MTTPAPNRPRRPVSLRLRICLIVAALIGGGAFALADHAAATPAIKRAPGAPVGMDTDVHIGVPVRDTATRIRATATTRSHNGREDARNSTVRRTDPTR